MKRNCGSLARVQGCLGRCGSKRARQLGGICSIVQSRLHVLQVSQSGMLVDVAASFCCSPAWQAGRCWCMGDLFGAFMVFPMAQCKAQEVYIYTSMYKL
jgi:hypothetical protein